MSPTPTVKCDIAPCVQKESWQKKLFPRIIKLLSLIPLPASCVEIEKKKKISLSKKIIVFVDC